MQKKIQFSHNKGTDMLKLGCTLANLANICLHRSTKHLYQTNFYVKPLCQTFKSNLQNIDEIFIKIASNICKSIFGIDASQLYPFSISQDMATGLYTRWEFDTDMQKFKARHNQTRNFENMIMSFYQETRSE